jgi:myosin heavy subunit
MIRGLENKVLKNTTHKPPGSGEAEIKSLVFKSPINQSILVSGESGAGKTVTTKIVLNYFAMLSMKRAEDQLRSTPSKSTIEPHTPQNDDISIEQQVLQSDPILESFGNARTIRYDNSSRFGKYIDVSFTKSGKLSGASIETYLLEKVRLIHPSPGERNYHIFYQFLKGATDESDTNSSLATSPTKTFVSSVRVVPLIVAMESMMKTITLKCWTLW